MKRPMYFVSIFDVNLHCVTSVQDETSREITGYDSVGGGKFNVPDAREPKTWDIECQLLQDGTQLSNLNTWSASEIFKQLDKAIEDAKNPVRLIVTNEQYPTANLSSLVWVKKYSKKEEYSGIYDVSISLEEWKPNAVKTTDIPFVPRPGKVPTPPKIAIKSSKGVYKAKAKYTGSKSTSIASTKSNPTMADLRLKDAKTNKPVKNIAAAKAKAYVPQRISDLNNNSSYGYYQGGKAVSAIDQLKGIGDCVTGVGKAISQAWQNSSLNKLFTQKAADYKRG